MLYRAISAPLQKDVGNYIKISSIGYAESKDLINFENRRFFFGPEYHWEAYATEDPRISKIDGKYYITYTAVSKWPPDPNSVKLALAVTEDFKEYKKLGIICPINSKAGAFFPEKINGHYAMILTIFPDLPPAKIILVYFNDIKDLLDPYFWKEQLSYPERLEKEIVIEGKPFVEVGTNPIYTDEGWLMFIPDIIYKNGNFYEFRISAILLDLEDPRKIIAYSKKPVLIPELEYETKGRSYPTTKIAMPTGILEEDDIIYIYYGASDLYISVAYVEKERILKYLLKDGRTKKV